ncbi:hypothetical protein [Agrococcus sp. SGAir0287]|uniref:hypothetical protein n=1 Tax=Agrococcus sp. SGAir0287 TaxID=2070347 RepID=UPI0010CCF04E|nr:hypothetical protein [Agrococcus sp. SGAir0287]QCR19796.1 hypothetical protein C1N71_10450 [Agrococcus sp. SGAir0287]
MRRQPILLRLAILCFVLGGFALFRNLVSTWSTLQDYPSAQFLPVFLSTRSASGGVDPILVYFVWGPLVFGGLGVVLLVVHLLTRAGGAVAVGAGAATAAGWQQPQQPGGWQPQEPQGWMPEQTQQQPGGWQPEQQQPGWQPSPPSAPQPGPVQPLGGTQPPPPNASDRIQP